MTRKTLGLSCTSVVVGLGLVLAFNQCGPGFSASIPKAVDPASMSSYDPVLAANGKVLYQKNCTACHADISATTKRDRTPAQITAALSLIPQMSALRDRLSPDDITAIAEALKSSTAVASCNGQVAGKTVVRRMNFREFSNSARDLLGTHSLTASDFPADYPGSTGFDNDDRSIHILNQDAEKIVAASEKVVDQILANTSSKYNQCNSSTGTSKTSCVSNLLLSTARKAFRRPVVAADIQPLIDIAVSASSVKDGVRDALVGIISSPRFLFHVVNYSQNRDGFFHTLSPHELASRMSFFLWSTIPDDELLGLADSGALMDPNVQKQQVQRMLKDPKAQSLLSTFPSQWLGYNKIASVTDTNRSLDLHPEFNSTLRSAMIKEADLMFNDMVSRDLSLDALITANYTFVDRSLASLYNIPFPNSSSSFAVVDLDGKTRRGILTQAAFMTLTSHSDYTNPIFRGAAILSKIVCRPPGKPPQNVSPLTDVDPTLTMKQRLAAHRTSQTCASCHQHIDPLGLAFENFDAVGKFRTMDGNNAIDPSGTTSDGFQFQKPGELANWVVADQKFKKCMALFLGSYGTGREIGSAEKCQTDKIILDNPNPDSITFKSLVEKLVTSDLFRKSYVQE